MRKETFFLFQLKTFFSCVLQNVTNFFYTFIDWILQFKTSFTHTLVCIKVKQFIWNEMLHTQLYLNFSSTTLDFNLWCLYSYWGWNNVERKHCYFQFVAIILRVRQMCFSAFAHGKRQATWKGWLISVIPATIPLSMHIRSEKQLLWKTAVLKDA